MATKYPHCAAALQYVRAVVAGKISACQWVKKACQRQINDLQTFRGKGAEYRFDKDRGERICRFIELLPHIKGMWAGQPIKLEPWQQFILTTVFGWVNADGYRRFRTVGIWVPRKNAKSTLSSGVALYMLLADGEGGAECYSAATTRDQARIVYRDAWHMARKARGLAERFGADIGSHTISVLETASKFEALSAEGSTLDGLNVHFACLDELHAHKTRSVYDVIEGACGSRMQSLLWLISTAGSNRAGVGYEQLLYLRKVLNGAGLDDTYFGVEYTVDEGDDWTDPATWAKANPNFGISVMPDDMARLCRKARQMTSAQPPFLTKRLNIWVNADSAWMDMRMWEKNGQPDLTLEDFAGKPCIIGLDLASKVDIAAVSYLFKDDQNYYVFGKYYLPEQAVENGTNSQYAGWEATGRLIATPGNVTDYQVILSDILDDVSRFQVQEVAYDPHQATMLVNGLMDAGVPVVEYRPTVLNFSEPMKELEALTLAGKMQHDGCPVLTWMVSNVVCHYDAKDNIYPRKDRPENKIDGVVALLMALGRSQVRRDSEPDGHYWENNDLLVV